MTRNDESNCPVETTLAVIGGKWKPLILWQLKSGVWRFGELQRLVPGVTRKMLTQHLRELERDGIVARKVYSEVPLKVEYSLTEYGRTLRPLLKELCDWGRKHEKRVVKSSGGGRGGLLFASDRENRIEPSGAGRGEHTGNQSDEGKD